MTSGSGSGATVGCKSAQSVRAFNLMKALVALALLGLLLMCWLFGWCKAGWCPAGLAVPAAVVAPPVAAPVAPAVVAPAAAPPSAVPPAVTPPPAEPPVLKHVSLSTHWVNGKLRLSGKPGSIADKEHALEAARQAFGADKVEDDLQVTQGNGAIEWIELNGEAATESERAATEAAVRKAFGADLRVDNRIVVKAAEAAAAAAPVPAAAGADCEAATRQNLAFFVNSAVLTVTDRAKLAAMLPCVKGRQFEIAGHTDNVGGEAHNLQLSQARADVVRAWFIRHGVAAGDVKATGYGQAKPVADNNSPEGRWKNRRVEIVWQ